MPIYLYIADCQWSDWSKCSATCGFAIQQRTILKEARNKGQKCHEKAKRLCRQEPCPIPTGPSKYLNNNFN